MSEEVDVAPAVSFNPIDGTIVFRLPASANFVLDLNSLRVLLTCQILKGDGSKLDYKESKDKDGILQVTRSDVSVTSSPLLSMFKSVELRLNGTTVGMDHNHYGPINWVIQELTTSYNQHKYLTDSLSLTNRDIFSPKGNTIKIEAGVMINPGLIERSRPFAKSDKVKLSGPILNGRFSCNLLIILVTIRCYRFREFQFQVPTPRGSRGTQSHPRQSANGPHGTDNY
jgi:hypothetical protein